MLLSGFFPPFIKRDTRLVRVTRLRSISKPEGKNEINLGSVYHRDFRVFVVLGFAKGEERALQLLQPQIIDILAAPILSTLPGPSPFSPFQFHL